MMKAILLLLLTLTVCNQAVKIPEKLASKTVVEPEAQCTFTVHKGGPNGPVISGNSLNFK